MRFALALSVLLGRALVSARFDDRLIDPYFRLLERFLAESFVIFFLGYLAGVFLGGIFARSRSDFGGYEFARSRS